MKIPDLKSPSFNREASVKKHFPEFYKFLLTQYPLELPWRERIYWYLNNLTTYPTCKICGEKTKFINAKRGYSLYCGTKCSNSDPDKINLTKRTCESNYGGPAPACSDEVKQKIKLSTFKKYGVENPMQNEEIKKKSLLANISLYGGQGNASTIIKAKYEDTLLKKYGVNNPMLCNELKEKLFKNNLKKYGVEHYSQTPEFKEKIDKIQKEIREKVYNTKKQNHTFNTSKIEQDFKQWLEENNIEYKYQYRSEEYPFNCDFYFPEKDLYFEIQGSWTHGGHPFDPESEEDKKTLSVMESKQTEYYNNAIEVWTVRDPLKRQWAKDHNLNWVEVFSCDLDDVIEIFKNF